MSDMGSELVSLVVPVYGVEKYLPACRDSILGHTYRHIEVILVDDGSPDGCPALCDAYARQDARVRVIHKANGGLSDARNAGLDVAAGGLIGFVDSDDIIHPEMVERCAGALEAEAADIVACSFIEFPEGADPRENCDDTEENRLIKRRGVSERRALDPHDAVELLLRDDELQNYVWNKLFRRELWQGIRFPVGQQFEDVNTTYKLFERAKRVVLLPDSLYFYRLRGDGIVRSRTLAGEFDCVGANLERYEALFQRYPRMCETMEDGIIRAMVRLWPLVWQERRTLSPALRKRLASFSAFARAHAGSPALRAGFGITGRLTTRLIVYPHAWSWMLAWMLYRAYRSRHDL